MIFTSYFGRMREFPENVLPVAICAKVPDWYAGARYSKLAPKYDLLMKWKDDHNNDEYEKCFRATTLEPLDLIRVLHELHMLLPIEVRTKMQSDVWNNRDWHVALLCYEKPSDFCHRHLVGEWLREHGIRCNEYKSLRGFESMTPPDPEVVQRLHDLRQKINYYYEPFERAHAKKFFEDLEKQIYDRFEEKEE